MSKEEREQYLTKICSSEKHNDKIKCEYHKDFIKNAPVLSAAGWGIMKELQTLIESNSTPLKSDGGDYTPLHYAARYGRTEAVEYLLNIGADPKASAYYGWTPLHWSKNEQITKMLIDKGADVNAKAQDGRTPIDGATLMQARLLIDAGAEIDMCYYGSSVTKTKSIDGSCPGILYTLGERNPTIAEEVLLAGNCPYQPDVTLFDIFWAFVAR